MLRCSPWEGGQVPACCCGGGLRHSIEAVHCAPLCSSLPHMESRLRLLRAEQTLPFENSSVMLADGDTADGWLMRCGFCQRINCVLVYSRNLVPFKLNEGRETTNERRKWRTCRGAFASEPIRWLGRAKEVYVRRLSIFPACLVCDTHAIDGLLKSAACARRPKRDHAV